jgi:hypothetical protein
MKSDTIATALVALISLVILLVLNVLMVLSSSLVSGLFMMIVLEILSNQTDGLIPALGYLPSVAVSFILTFIAVAANRLAAVRSVDTKNRR